MFITASYVSSFELVPSSNSRYQTISRNFASLLAENLQNKVTSSPSVVTSEGLSSIRKLKLCLYDESRFVEAEREQKQLKLRKNFRFLIWHG